MALRRYVFFCKKGRRCKYLNVCISMYILNGSLPSLAKTFVLPFVFLTLILAYIATHQIALL